MDKLKPCPFCGEKNAVVIRINYTHAVRFNVRCRQCSCMLNRRFVSEEEAAYTWNRRVGDTDGKERTE